MKTSQTHPETLVGEITNYLNKDLYGMYGAAGVSDIINDLLYFTSEYQQLTIHANEYFNERYLIEKIEEDKDFKAFTRIHNHVSSPEDFYGMTVKVHAVINLLRKIETLYKVKELEGHKYH